MVTQPEPVPSPQRYVDALQSIKRTEHRIKLLRIHYFAPERTITAIQMANAMEHLSYITVNSNYGKLGRLVGAYLNFRPTHEKLGSLVTFEQRQGEWHWIMRPEVVSALKTLGWFEQPSLPEKVVATTDLLREQSQLLLPEKVAATTDLFEGAVTQIKLNRYERNVKARKKCIDHYGTRCSICNFDFSIVYGRIGNGYIHVHHLRQLSSLGTEYTVDPIADLRPICPNCHAMVHCRTPPYTIEEIRTILASSRNDDAYEIR